MPVAETGATATTTYTRATAVATRGDLTRVQNPVGHRTDFTYDPVTGLVTSATDRLGNKSTQQHDQVGRIQWRVTPKGNVSGADPDDFKTSYVTDVAGRITGTEDPLGNGAAVTYDANGNVRTTTDALGRTTTVDYDRTDLPVAVELPDGTGTQTIYDPEAHVAETVDRDQRDAADRVTALTGTDGRTTGYRYDPAGNLLEVELPGGDCGGGSPTGCITNTHDDAGQVVATQFSDPSTPDVTYDYGDRGELTSFTDGTGTTSYSYDSLGRQTAASDGNGATTGYEWNLAGLQTAIVYPGGERVTKAYDNAGRLTQVRDWTNRNYTYAYDRNSNVVSLTYPQNVDVFSYDNADRPTGATYRRGSTTLPSLAVETAATGRIDAATATGLPVGDEVFGYDALDQLVDAGGAAYSYDLSSNPTLLAGDTRQVFDDANQLCFAAPVAVTGGSCAAPPTGATTYTYGNRGQRTSMAPAGGPATSYGYDEADRLVQVATAGQPTTTYDYDGRGIRQSATRDAITTRYTWDHVSGLPRLLTESTGPDTTRWVYGAGEAPLAQYDSAGTPRFLHHDHIDSVRLVTAANGTVLGARSWSAYGDAEETTGTPGTRFGYAGAYEDPDTGFLYLRARYYDPETAQFLTRDPLETISGSAYGYVYNSPVNGTDPSGLRPGLEPDRPQHWKQDIANFSGGVLEAITVGQWKRSSFLASRVDTCSTAFQNGVIAGTVVDLALGAKGADSIASRGRGLVDSAPTASRGVPGTSIEPLWAQAPHRGFLAGWSRPETIRPGAVIDRYGHDTGRFFSPAGTPFEARSLPAGSGPLQRYEVLKPLEVQAGLVAPAFGQPGMGIQYMSSQTVADLIEAGIMKAVN